MCMCEGVGRGGGGGAECVRPLEGEGHEEFDSMYMATPNLQGQICPLLEEVMF